MLSFQRPLFVAHRGFSERYPENTMAAFEAAVQAGSRMIELDVTLSKDGEVVVIHDATVDRTTDGNGWVKALTCRELKQLDAGTWFHPHFANQRIPTLAEVLDAFGSRILINIEIKAEEAPFSAAGVGIEKKVVRMVRQRHLAERVLISSFDETALEAVVRIEGHPAVALLSEEAPDETWLRRCKALGVFSFHPKFGDVTSEIVEQWQAERIWVLTWNVRSKKDVTACLRMKVDGMFVDDPLMAASRSRPTAPGGFSAV